MRQPFPDPSPSVSSRPAARETSAAPEGAAAAAIGVFLADAGRGTAWAAQGPQATAEHILGLARTMASAPLD